MFRLSGDLPPLPDLADRATSNRTGLPPRGPGPCGSHVHRLPHFSEQICGEGGLGSAAPPEKRSQASSRGKVREKQTSTPPSGSRLASRDLGDAGAQAEEPMGVTWETCKTPGAQAAGTQVPLGGDPCPAATHLVSWELPEFCMHPSPPAPQASPPLLQPQARTKLFKNSHPAVRNSSCHLTVENKSNCLLVFRECSWTLMTCWSPTCPRPPVVFSFSSHLSPPHGRGICGFLCFNKEALITFLCTLQR